MKIKLKHLLIPYILFIIIIPGILTHIGSPFGLLSTSIWQWIIDAVMLLTAITGMTVLLIRYKGRIRGWIPLMILIILFILPQLYLWKTQAKGLRELRLIWRFSLLFITLFVIPLDIHYSKNEICLLIGLILFYGLICCAYEIWQHPRFWEYMSTLTRRPKGSVESFFEQKNRFGAYLALWAILSLFALQISQKKYWIIPVIIFTVFLVMTESRGGMLLEAVYAICCLISYHRRFGWKNIIMIFVDVLIVLCIIWIIPPLRSFFQSWIDIDRGVTGRDRIWEVSYGYYLESNPFLGHGIGVQIEKILIERLGTSVSTHNVYLYILNSGGILLAFFYILSFMFMLIHPAYRHHYLIPLLIAVLVYGFFELSCGPFIFWHLTNLFTVCLFFIPSVAVHHHHENTLQIHWTPEDEESSY